ncbi:MAG: UbiA family prenyltransferase [Roseiarcus sp.]
MEAIALRSEAHTKAEFVGNAVSLAVWFRAFRIHQWSKNALVLVPAVLGWHQVTPRGVGEAVVAMLLLCGVASLAYCVNDIADIEADRAHWSKRDRPFASGALSVRSGALVSGLGIPALVICGVLVSPSIGLWLAVYTSVTLAYAAGLKRVPLFDTVIIAALFTIRIVLGTIAARLLPSPWLLTFSMFFFFSLATAKRHAELLHAGLTSTGPIEGRGYNVEDKEVTFAFGIVASVASVLIIIIYLTEDVFPLSFYPRPEWLWAIPVAVFLWVGRIWLLAHRGAMTDDPVHFALRDRVSLYLGAVVVVAFVLALL